MNKWKINVLFLDFNGVLDTYDNMDVIDYENLSILKELVYKTNSKIVISSSIRSTYFYTGKHNKIMIYLLETLKNNNIDVYGITPKLESREEEIKTYLKNHPEIDNYYIIDDDYYFESMSEHMIKLKSQMDGGNGLKEYDFSTINKKR